MYGILIWFSFTRSSLSSGRTKENHEIQKYKFSSPLGGKNLNIGLIILQKISEYDS